MIKLDRSNNSAVIVEFDNDINPAYMNGYEGGMYNVSVTAFNVDDGDAGLFMYAQKKDGERYVTNKKRETLQRSSRRLGRSLLNRIPLRKGYHILKRKSMKNSQAARRLHECYPWSYFQNRTDYDGLTLPTETVSFPVDWYLPWEEPGYSVL